jgi:hypothetical protein
MKDLVLKKIGELRKVLKTQGLTSEASLLLLLLKFAGYDDEWRAKVDQLATSNTRPFSDWFGGEERVYLPFEESAVVVDSDVEEALNSLGFKITDYIRGYAEKDGRRLKIGKVLARAKRDAIKHINNLVKNLEGTEGTEGRINELEEHKASLNIYWDNVSASFRDSPHRAHKEHRGNLMIIISQNPHDLAQMSYERSWTSCMNLGEGAYYRELLCEVEGGGLVAYLVNQDDTEIKKPIARIHIRRFDGQDGRVIAVPENTVYGEDVEGFSKVVQNWLDGMNKDYPVGRYSMKGGTYSDTFAGSNHIVAPENEADLLEWFRGELPDPKSTSWVAVDDKYYDLSEHGYWSEDNPFWHHEDDDGEKVFDTEEKAKMFIERLKYNDMTDEWIELLYGDEIREAKSDEEIDDIIDNAREERFKIRRSDSDHTVAMKDAAITKIIKLDNKKKRKGESRIFSPEIYKEIADFLKKERSYWDDSKKDFYSAYPEYITSEEFLEAPYPFQEQLLIDMKGQVPSEHEERLRTALKGKIMDYINISNDRFNVKKSNSPADSYWGSGYSVSPTDVRYGIYTGSNMLRGLDYIDDELFDHMSDFIFNQLFNTGMGDEDLPPTMINVISALRPEKISTENLKKLIRKSFAYYKDVSWEYDEEVSIHTMGHHIMHLKQDGAEFLERLRRQLNTIDSDFKPRSLHSWDPNASSNQKKLMESRVVYVINTIISGKTPNKGWFAQDMITKEDLLG